MEGQRQYWRKRQFGNSAMTNQEKEAQFFSLLSLTASKYGLEIRIDPETRNVDLVGEADRRTVVICAMEMARIAESYKDIVR